MRNSLFSRLRTSHRPAKEEDSELFEIVSRRTRMQRDMVHCTEKTQDSNAVANAEAYACECCDCASGPHLLCFVAKLSWWLRAWWPWDSLYRPYALWYVLTDCRIQSLPFLLDRLPNFRSADQNATEFAWVCRKFKAVFRPIYLAEKKVTLPAFLRSQQ